MVKPCEEVSHLSEDDSDSSTIHRYAGKQQQRKQQKRVTRCFSQQGVVLLRTKSPKKTKQTARRSRKAASSVSQSFSSFSLSHPASQQTEDANGAGKTKKNDRRSTSEEPQKKTKVVSSSIPCTTASQEDGPSNKPPVSRRGLLKRQNSSMRASCSNFAVHMQADDEDCPPPAELMDSFAFGDDEDCLDARPKSILKRHNSGTKSQSLSVRFAGEQVDNKVWCLVRPIDKVSADSKSTLWWTEGELDLRQDEDADTAELMALPLSRLLRKAFASCTRDTPEDDDDSACCDFDGQAMSQCAEARGLESVAFPELKAFQRLHRHAVLRGQEMIRAETGETNPELLRWQSLKHSQASARVARRMGAFDESEASFA